ncbi:MAG: argininosuccinate lyase [Bacteroidota bacterium]|nr:argininosuccinate lyase [Bacteroidota bacterium]MDP4194730.1 argininosuccinate lyase [Bacteroidota bacterium]
MLWGGRFKESLDSEALKFSSSIQIDKTLLPEDIQGSKVHASMLKTIGILSDEEYEKISNGLTQIEEEYLSGLWKPDESIYEDIHSAIESKLNELIGQAAGKLHTGRSRNDQIITAVRLWVKKACEEILEVQKEFQNTLLKLAEDNTTTIIPGYTHLQRAQPISFAFHLLAYVEMLGRDCERVKFTSKMADESPLGSGALAGSTLPLDREFTCKELGFNNPSRNALDAVSDRDFLLEFLNSCAIGMMHLSRFAEEIVLWSTSEWKFIRLADSFTTGSSLMPQKKNSDLAELTRGKTGRTFGNYMALLTTMKGLPLSYNRDMQEDKESVFDSFNTYYSCLKMMKGMMETVNVNKTRYLDELKGDFSLATDLADWLVLKGIPFRQAHHIVGKVVQLAEEKGILFDELTVEDLKAIHPIFDMSAMECFEIKTALERKKTFGSPNPKMVSEQISFWKEKVKD